MQKGCLSEEEVKKAWEYHRKTQSTPATALKFHVHSATLYRAYKRYELALPIHKKHNRKNKTDAVLK